jgi:hypothetical protein
MEVGRLNVITLGSKLVKKENIQQNRPRVEQKEED